MSTSLKTATACACLLMMGACRDNDRLSLSSSSHATDTARAPRNAVGVIVGVAREEDFPYEIEALGTAHANEAVTLTSKVSNLISAIHFREGEQVQAGQILVELDGTEAKAELSAAQAALSESRTQFKRAQELRATQVLSQSELDRLTATLEASQARVITAQAKVDDTIIRAPFDGRVGLRRISIGSLVSPGAIITTLDDTRTIKLDFSVPENFMSILKEGLKVAARSIAWPDREFRGVVVSIDSRVDPVSRSVLVRAAIPNPDGALKPGMFLTLRLRQPREKVIMIPEQALVPEQGKQYVFVVRNDTAEKRQIDIGRRKPGAVEVTSGLTAGERIVVEGTQQVKDGTAVRETVS